jgi:hypothetical protein
LESSKLEESKANFQGIACEHIDGEDDVVAPVDPSASLAEVREKMNSIVEQIKGNSEFQKKTKHRISKIEDQLNSAGTSAALKSHSHESLEVKNSTVLESALVVVCICFTAFMSLQIINFVRRNYLGRPEMTRTSSESALEMSYDDL